MPKLFNVNPFAEAMLYYEGITNDSRMEKRLANLIELQPAQKEKFEKMLGPIVELERYLDSHLDVDRKLVLKYFRMFDSGKSKFPFGFCLGVMMVFYPLMEHVDWSADEINAYLLDSNFDKTTYTFFMNLADSYETFMPNKIKAKDVLKQLKDSSLDSKDKWEILEAAYDYPTHIMELLSIITPAAKLIESRKDLYDPLIEQFNDLYSGDNAQRLLTPHCNNEFKFNDIVMISPSLFGFDRCIKIFPNKLIQAIEVYPQAIEENPILQTSVLMLVGIAHHLIIESPYNDAVEFSKKFQTLSDPIRLQILFYLCSHKEYGRMLCRKFGLQHSTLSYHITKLLDSGFITAEISGTQTFYSADKENIINMIDSFLAKIN